MIKMDLDMRILAAVGGAALLLYLLREHLQLKDDFRDIERYIYETYHQMASQRMPAQQQHMAARQAAQQRVPRPSPTQQRVPHVQPRNIPRGMGTSGTGMPPMPAGSDDAMDILGDNDRAPILSRR